MGLFQYAQGGFACLTRLKIAMSLHQCQRSHRRNHRLPRGNNTGKQERNNNYFTEMQHYDACSRHEMKGGRANVAIIS